MKPHYIDNKLFLKEILAYREEIASAALLGEESPRLSEYLGECFIKIANELSSKSNFVNYTFRDEMISDAIENCFMYANRFDPAKSSNPFAYFTQIAYYAFLRRILTEKKHLKKKYRYIESLDLDSVIRQIHDEGETGGQLVSYLKKQVDIARQDAMTDETPASMKRKPKYLQKKAALPEEPVDLPIEADYILP